MIFSTTYRAGCVRACLCGNVRVAWSEHWNPSVYVCRGIWLYLIQILLDVGLCVCVCAYTFPHIYLSGYVYVLNATNPYLKLRYTYSTKQLHSDFEILVRDRKYIFQIRVKFYAYFCMPDHLLNLGFFYFF